MDSFFIYRLPGENHFAGGIGTVKTGIHTGFLISSFYNLPEATLTICKQEDFSLDSLCDFQNNRLSSLSPKSPLYPIFPFPNHTTDKEEYFNDLNCIVSELGENEKTVYCRAICGNERINLSESLVALDKSYPDAMIYCFHTPYSGTWIGATPENLLSNENGLLNTMALAGTLNTDSGEGWDNKNIEEQRIVADYIGSVFTRNGVNFSKDPQPITKRVGKLAHLCTNFHAQSPGFNKPEHLREFLYDLSPTPALCGYPKEKAFEIINKKEKFSRAYYGGFVGPVFSADHFILYVILRSVRISANKWCMYAGGGITKCSIPEKEWMETENKASSILEKLQFIR